MAETFKAGDTVRLKSGGPLMTVNHISRDGEVWCEWFDDSNAPQKHYFRPEMLEQEA